MYEIRFWGYLPNAPKRYIRLKAGVLPFPIGDSSDRLALVRRNPTGYTRAMITGFAHKGLEDFFYDGSKRGIQPRHAQRLADILDRLDAAQYVSDMHYPGSDLHPLQGTLAGYWAVRVSGNWRVIFCFEAGNAFSVNYVDYH
jgi:proteic killer suppression protein